MDRDPVDHYLMGSTRDRATAVRRFGAVALAVAVAVGASTGADSAGVVETIVEPAGAADLERADRLTRPADPSRVSDDFAGTGPLIGYTTNNPGALPDVSRVDGRYRAVLTDNTDNRTLHFNDAQGRLDAKLVSFPFEYIVRNVGIGSLADSQVPIDPVGSVFAFAGVQVHSTDLAAADSAHVVVGHRGSTRFTVEGKNTVAGDSQVSDVGANAAPDGRADIRIVGNANRTLTVYWQPPNLGTGPDDWQLYAGTGNLPGPTAAFGNDVYIGLITYAFDFVREPFVGTADSVQLVGE